MKSILITLLAACSILFSFAPLYANNTPKEVGGFRLGADITQYPDIEYSNFLKEVVVTDWHGFRKGVISYGICAYPGKIVKISMKYENPSKTFYQTLLDKFKEQYGKPTLWEGDAFGILYKWKWKFTDENGQMVNLVLQHNLKDPSENIGNSVKLSYPDREKEERLCFNAQCEKNKSKEEKEKIEERKKMSWEHMIPR